MSTVKTNNVQVGQSGTATNNFTLYQPAVPDGTVRLGVGNAGATTADAITVTSAGNMTVLGTVRSSGITTNIYPLVSGTAIATTGLTVVDFANIPSWVKRVTVLLQGVSTNGTASIQIQLGTGAGPTYTTSGYLGAAGTSLFTTGFGITGANVAAAVVHGAVVISNFSGNAWLSSGSVGRSDAGATYASGGSVSLAAALTAVRITANGIDTFDAGSINIMYE